MITPSELTLRAAKDSSIQNIAGVCVDKPQFVQQLNESVGRLMSYGNWWNTVVKGRVCAYNNCISWPRFVGTLLATNLGGGNRPIFNKWYDFMPLTSADCVCTGRSWPSNVAVVDDGVSPVFQNVPCGTSLSIQVYARVRADLGKTVTLYGLDEFGQEVMIRNANTGEWSQGETLAMASPLVQSSVKYREITRISKQVTAGPVDVYMFDVDTNTLLEMAHYEPNETEPRYRHTSLRGTSGLSCCSTRDGTKARTITFLAKLRHIPVVADTDIVQIDNIPALKLMIQAIRLEESGNDQEAAAKQALAIKELNRALADKLPLNQIPIRVAPEGTAIPSHAGIGQIM